FQVSFWRMTWHVYRRTQESPMLRALAVGLAGSMAGLLVHGLVDNSIFVLDLSYVFMLLLALPTLLGKAVDAEAQT
ncbi:MAG: hypothetical protein JW910_16445, partial [Anaerolineae bacterium]|nr:hypothetical protein [Anaerolineae bacterium]